MRTLILADNELDRLVLILDEDDFEEEDSKSSESFEAIDATGKVDIFLYKNNFIFYKPYALRNLCNSSICCFILPLTVFTCLTCLKWKSYIGLTYVFKINKYLTIMINRFTGCLHE